MKKIIAIISALLLLIPLSVFVSADDTVYTEGTLHYTVENESITIINCFGKDDEVTVPAIIAGIPVNTIAKGAFAGNKYLKKLNLPDTITVVEEGAIADGITVVYNANTDHPQNTPTDLINGNAPIPAQIPDETSGNGNGNGNSTTPTPSNTPGESSGGKSSPDAESGRTPEPIPGGTTPGGSGQGETPIGGGEDIDTDDYPAADPETSGDETDLPESGSDTSDDGTAPHETETGADTDDRGTPEKARREDEGKGNAASVLPWAIPCGVVAAGGIAAGSAVLISKKKKKK